MRFNQIYAFSFLELSRRWEGGTYYIHVYTLQYKVMKQDSTWIYRFLRNSFYCLLLIETIFLIMRGFSPTHLLK